MSRRLSLLIVLALVVLVAALPANGTDGTSRQTRSTADEFLSILEMQRGSLTNTGRNASNANPVIHLIRIPKAGSSSLSAVARRLAGCTPPGPCCKYPGSPVGSCPAPPSNPSIYQCENVIGCMGHNPHMEYFSKPKVGVITITMLREPVSRSLSAFCYYPPHTNCIQGNCTDADLAFDKYTKSLVYKNVAVKMLSGSSPYRLLATCQRDCPNSVQNAVANMKSIDFIGVSELWEISMLLLHLNIPSFTLDRSDFDLRSLDSKGSRSHTGLEYENFVAKKRETHKTDLLEQNSLDIELYRLVLGKLCEDLHRMGLWSAHEIIRRRWYDRAPKEHMTAAPKCSARS